MKNRKNDLYINIPQEMKKLPRWVKWRRVSKKDKYGNIKSSKIPYSIKDSSSYNWNNFNNWEDYNTARNYIDGYDGLGYVLVERDNIVTIDLDNCIKNKKLNSFSKKIVEVFNGTYMEVSQSGKGIHIFLKGNILKNINLQSLGIEIYKNNRYIALTGDMGDSKYFSPSNIILNKDKEINFLYDYCINKDKKRLKKKDEINTGGTLRKSILKGSISPVNISCMNEVPDLNSVLDTMNKTNSIASSLINGKSYTGDPSRDDFIFLLLAKNYTHRDPILMKELFLMTSLNRLITGEKRKCDIKYREYLQRSIDKVVSYDGYRPFDWTPHNKYKKRIKSYEKR